MADVKAWLHALHAAQDVVSKIVRHAYLCRRCYKGYACVPCWGTEGLQNEHACQGL